jgi:dihydroorotate dehydrogenase (fumarate)
MLNLTTTYLGLELEHPLVASASPLSKKVDLARRLEEAGAAALVMYSLFEEQITYESRELDHYLNRGSESYAEALSYFPDMERNNRTQWERESAFRRCSAPRSVRCAASWCSHGRRRMSTWSPPTSPA